MAYGIGPCCGRGRSTLRTWCMAARQVIVASGAHGLGGGWHGPAAGHRALCCGELWRSRCFVQSVLWLCLLRTAYGAEGKGELTLWGIAQWSDQQVSSAHYSGLAVSPSPSGHGSRGKRWLIRAGAASSVPFWWGEECYHEPLSCQSTAIRGWPEQGPQALISRAQSFFSRSSQSQVLLAGQPGAGGA